MSKICDLIGKVLKDIEVDYNYIIFKTTDDKKYRMYHRQDCCESVTIDDICGDWQDLIGLPIIIAEMNTNYRPQTEKEKEKTNKADSYTWTFYKLATAKGYVDIKWFGESNGYYSTSVDFEER